MRIDKLHRFEANPLYTRFRIRYSFQRKDKLVFPLNADPDPAFYFSAIVQNLDPNHVKKKKYKHGRPAKGTFKNIVNQFRPGFVASKKRAMIRHNDTLYWSYVGNIILNISEFGHTPETFSGKL